MDKRKKYVVNKQFQYGTTFRIMAMVLLVLGILTVGVGVHSIIANRSLQLTVSKLGDTIVDQQHMIYALREYPEFRSITDKKIASKILSRNIDENIKLMESNIKRIEKRISMNNIIIISILLFILLQALLSYIYILRKTNSISGPVFVMNRHIRKVLNGEESEIRSLRKNDEFKELYNSLAELSDKYRSMTK